jgi:hypothetical protein
MPRLILIYRDQGIFWYDDKLCVCENGEMIPAPQELLREILESAGHHMDDARKRLTEWAEVANV